MNIKEISTGIFYVGVNDRVTQRFESLWPLPYGVTYNSYIVKGSGKTALIDTVEIPEVEELLRNIRAIGADPDYLVINHMEPDHSGSIPVLADEFPDMKIVGNKLTLGMVKGYYHIDESRFREVADGEAIEIGGKTLQFVLTPMVHWPETMMTYVKEDKLIFSGDAFGTFGALNGGVVDDEIDTALFFEEAYRYYSNIVGKYGRFVQAAFKKVAPLEIGTICPTHGPVWRSKVADITALYDRLSRYESEEGVVIVYGSMYGNTASCAEKIAERLAARGVRNIRIHNAAFSEMSYMIRDCYRFKTLIIGSPTYQMEIFPPVRTLMEALKSREVKGKTLALFGSYTWASGALPKLQNMAGEMKLPVVASFCMKQSLSEETLAEIDAMADAIINANA